MPNSVQMVQEQAQAVDICARSGADRTATSVICRQDSEFDEDRRWPLDAQSDCCASLVY